MKCSSSPKEVCASCGSPGELEEYEISPKVTVFLCQRCIHRTEHNYREATESDEHYELKKCAKEKLRQFGFTDDEIFEEYKVKYGSSWGWVDVVGVNSSQKIGIECVTERQFSNWGYTIGTGGFLAKEKGFEVYCMTVDGLFTQDGEEVGI